MEAITIPEVESYLYGLLPARDAVLAEMEDYAKLHDVPIVGPAVGRLLYQYALLIGARRIFEMGSAIGYSTLWWAQAVGEGGKVYYTDGDPKNAERARASFQRAGVSDRVEVLVGDSLELIQQTAGEFDIVFNDVDKHQYPEVFRLAVPRVLPGGLFITDNVFWSGRVGRPVEKGDRETPAILEFNRLVNTSTELLTTMIPLRDGLAVCLKL